MTHVWGEHAFLVAQLKESSRGALSRGAPGGCRVGLAEEFIGLLQVGQVDSLSEFLDREPQNACRVAGSPAGELQAAQIGRRPQFESRCSTVTCGSKGSPQVLSAIAECPPAWSDSAAARRSISRVTHDGRERASVRA